MDIASVVLMSRSDVLQRQLEVMANNVANASTTGFKPQRNLFDTYLATPNGVAATASNTLTYVIDRGTFTNFEQGSIGPTGNPLDVAIEGAGFFAVQTPEGPAYTRAGSFTLNSNGQLVNQAGLPVLVGNAPLTIPENATNISISRDGTISADGQNLGRLQAITFENTALLKADGGGLYRTTETGTPNEKAILVQGSLEQSAVVPVLEMTQIMELSRSYQQTQRIIDQEHERQRNAIRVLSRTTA